MRRSRGQLNEGAIRQRRIDEWTNPSCEYEKDGGNYDEAIFSTGIPPPFTKEDLDASDE